MIVKKVLLILMAVAMLYSIAACMNPESALSMNSPAPEQSEAPSANFAASETEQRCFVTADHYEETFLAEDGATELLHVSYAMPVVTIDDEAASGRINSALRDLKERFLHTESEERISVDAALADAKSAREQGYDGPAYAMEQTFTLPRFDCSIICILQQA